VVTPEQIADAVFAATHPVHWRTSGSTLHSPPTTIDGETYVVQVYRAGRTCYFPFVEVVPGDTFRSWDPWGWPTGLLQLAHSDARLREETRRRLLAATLEPPGW